MNNYIAQPYGLLYSVISGNGFSLPIDLTTKYQTAIPYFKKLVKLSNTTLDFNDKKSTNVPIQSGSGYIMDMIFIQNSFPKLYAKNRNDKVAYCDYPALAQIRTIEVKISSYKLESLSYITLLEKMKKHYYENFEYFGRNWLGGAEIDCPTDLQKFEGFTGAYWDDSDYSKNVIKNEYKWRVPVMASIFLNEEKFKFILSLDSLMELTLGFNKMVNFLHRTEQYVPPDVQGDLDIYIMWLSPNDKYYYNKLPYIAAVDPDYFDENSRYHTGDISIETSEKRFAYSQDFKLNVKLAPIIRYYLYLIDLSYCQQNRFWGKNIETSVKNYIAAHILPNNRNTSLDGTFKLSDGKFANGTSVSGIYSIEEWAPNKKSFFIKFLKTSTKFYLVEVKCTKAFDTLGELYFDINAFQMDQRQSRPQLYFLKEFTLDIVDYDTQPSSRTLFFEEEDLSTSIQNGTKLNSGFFTYAPDPAAQTTKFAFMSISNLQKSLFISDETYSICMSQEITGASNTGNALVLKNAVYLSNQVWSWLDLDRKYRQEINSIVWEKQNGITDTFEEDFIEYTKDLHTVQRNIRPDYDFQIQHVDPRTKFETRGYIDLGLMEYQNVQPTLKDVTLMFDGSPLTTVLKDRQFVNKNQMLIYGVQEIHRFSFLNDRREYVLMDVTQRNRLIQPIKEYFAENGLFEDVVQKRSADDNDNLAIKKMKKDNFSMNNNMLMPVGAGLNNQGFAPGFFNG